ncbi:MAG: hypothetical protein AB7I33_03750 [Gemmatimonadales bacterium]
MPLPLDTIHQLLDDIVDDPDLTALALGEPDLVRGFFAGIRRLRNRLPAEHVLPDPQDVLADLQLLERLCPPGLVSVRGLLLTALAEAHAWAEGAGSN